MKNICCFLLVFVLLSVNTVCSQADGSQTAHVEVTVGPCVHTPGNGSWATVTFTIDHAIVVTDSGNVFTETVSYQFPPGNHRYDWQAESGWNGTGTGEFYIEECVPLESLEGLNVTPFHVQFTPTASPSPKPTDTETTKQERTANNAFLVTAIGLVTFLAIAAFVLRRKQKEIIDR